MSLIVFRSEGPSIMRKSRQENRQMKKYIGITLVVWCYTLPFVVLLSAS